MFVFIIFVLCYALHIKLNFVKMIKNIYFIFYMAHSKTYRFMCFLIGVIYIMNTYFVNKTYRFIYVSQI